MHRRTTSTRQYVLPEGFPLHLLTSLAHLNRLCQDSFESPHLTLIRAYGASLERGQAFRSEDVNWDPEVDDEVLRDVVPVADLSEKRQKKRLKKTGGKTEKRKGKRQGKRQNSAAVLGGDMQQAVPQVSVGLRAVGGSKLVAPCQEALGVTLAEVVAELSAYGLHWGRAVAVDGRRAQGRQHGAEHQPHRSAVDSGGDWLAGQRVTVP